ncbi:unnamed protein product [Linum trigynum]|uniref:Uncharacterized protein n=1 Tax=Linum trigynum TaxID=586398 RepID=A0AAV2GVG2_9ROSI
MGTSFLLCWLCGFLADSFLGRFKTIAIFPVVQALVQLQEIHVEPYSPHPPGHRSSHWEEENGLLQQPPEDSNRPSSLDNPWPKAALIRRHENPPDIGLPADPTVQGEAFIYPGKLDFFIKQSPKVMKAMSTGLFLTTLTFGFFVISFLVMVVKKVTQSGKLDCFYGLLAVLGVVNFAVFLVCVVLVGKRVMGIS